MLIGDYQVAKADSINGRYLVFEIYYSFVRDHAISDQLLWILGGVGALVALLFMGCTVVFTGPKQRRTYVHVLVTIGLAALNGSVLAGGVFVVYTYAFPWLAVAAMTVTLSGMSRRHYRPQMGVWNDSRVCPV